MHSWNARRATNFMVGTPIYLNSVKRYLASEDLFLYVLVSMMGMLLACLCTKLFPTTRLAVYFQKLLSCQSWKCVEYNDTCIKT